MEEKNNIVIYQLEDGKTKIDVKLEDETVWLSQQQMAELFSTSRTNIIEHINNIYAEEELDKNSTCQNFRQVRIEGNRTVNREITYYNLDKDVNAIAGADGAGGIRQIGRMLLANNILKVVDRKSTRLNSSHSSVSRMPSSA